MDFESDRLIFKELSWDDLEFIHRLHSIPEVDEYNTLGIPADIEETRKVISPLIKSGTGSGRHHFSWVILEKNLNKPIGLCGMIQTGDRFRSGEIYFKFLPDSWGKGYGTECAKKLIGIGFTRLHLHRIEAGVATGNSRSIRVIEKSGMTCEGIRRKTLPIRGEWKDNFHYAILEEEFNRDGQDKA